MRGESNHSRQESAPKTDPQNQMCCVYWCRSPAVIKVPVGDKQYGACRIHAAFIRAGKLDWFDR